MKKNLLLLLPFAMLSCSSAKKQMHTKSFAKNPVVAHRGAFKKNGFPENSLASLREAIRLQCTGSEFDVRMTSDDSLVINHDPKFNGMQIEKTSYDELMKYKLANGESLPTLHNYLAEGLKDNTTTRLVLEIKPSDISKERARIVTEKIVNEVKKMAAVSYVVYISFDYDILKAVLENDPHASVQYLNGDKAPADLKKDGIAGADYHYSVFQKNPQWIQEAKDNGIILNAWTVNETPIMQWLLDNGFNFITTNEPEQLLQLSATKK